MTVTRIDALPAGLEDLIENALAEDFRAIARLRTEWDQGENRFDAPGEALFEARVGDRLVGICGLNVDPFEQDPSVGRVRRFYVAPDARRQGVGRALIEAAIDAAQGRFRVLQLRTRDAVADAFYQSLGFEPEAGRAHVTHGLRLD